jgi:single-strand DNA-binding protein
MGTINKVLLIGRLGRDPEERKTGAGKCVSRFSLATDIHRNGNGEKKTEWHRIVVFGKVAEQCNHYLRKGRLVCVEGSLATRCWEKSPGEKHYYTDVVASRVAFLDFKGSDSTNSVPAENTSEEPF